MSLRSDVKDLKERVEALETELDKQLKRVPDYDAYWSAADIYFGIPIPTKDAPTLRAQVDAILNHLQLDVEVVPENRRAAHIKATNRGKK